MRKEQQAPDKLASVSMIIAAFPAGVWYAVTFLVLTFIGVAVWLFHDSMQHIVLPAILIVGAILVATAIIVHYARLIYSAYMGVKDVSLKNAEIRKARANALKAEASAKKTVLEVDMGYRYLPRMIDGSIESGKNYKYLGFESTHHLSNLHTLQEVPQAPQIAQASDWKPPTFAELHSTGQIIPNEETSIIGYVDGQENRDKWNRLYSFMVFGMSGSGKSSTVAYYLALAVLHGARVLLIDPESEEQDSITRRLAPISHLFLIPVGDTPTSAKRVLQVAKQEIDNPSDFPVIFIVDEYSTLMRKAKDKGDEWGKIGSSLSSLVEDYAQRGRKRNRVAIVIGQITGASRTGGTEVRNSMTAVFAHRLPAQQARLILDNETANQCPQLEQGEAMVMLTNSPMPIRMRIPYIEPEDMHTVAHMVNDQFGTVESMPDAQPDASIDQEPIQFPIATMPEEGKRAEDVDLAEAIEYWNEERPAIRDIQAEYDLTFYQARRLRGFILAHTDSKASD